MEHNRNQFYSNYGQQISRPELQFYPTAFEDQNNNIQQPLSSNYMDNDRQISWTRAFGTGGYPNEPPLVQELGINFSHIKQKSFAVLNPFGVIDKHLMDDIDLVGPILFCLMFGAFLMLKGNMQFGYIYGLALIGCLCIYCFLNLMSETGIDGYRAASVLGYCLLPMVILSFVSILQIQTLAFALGLASVLWCTFSSSAIFVTVLSMKDQRALIAYPLALFYTCFAMLTIF